VVQPHALRASSMTNDADIRVAKSIVTTSSAGWARSSCPGARAVSGADDSSGRAGRRACGARCRRPRASGATSGEQSVCTVQFRNMAERDVEVSLRLSEAEFVGWSRAAAKSNTDLPSWIRTIISDHVARPTPHAETAGPAGGPEALHWLDGSDIFRACEFCGSGLAFTATRRRRFCSDECRLRAWRLRVRSAASQR
jgi:hypothetical protein